MISFAFPCSGKPVEVPHWELPPSNPSVTPALGSTEVSFAFMQKYCKGFETS